MATARAAADTDRTRDRAGRFDERFLRKLESLVLTIRRSARMSARPAAREPRVEARRRRAGVRRPPRLRRRATICATSTGTCTAASGASRCGCSRRKRTCSSRCSSTPARRWAFGDPAKLDLALQIGAALVYVGLANLDRVAVSPLGDDDAPVLPPARGKGAILPILRFLDGVQANGRVGLAAAVRAFLSRRRRRQARPGDRHLRFLRSGRPPRGAGSAAAPQAGGRRHPGERARRSWRPRCTATSSCATSRPARSRELTVSPAVLAAYRRRHQALLRDLEGYCRERAIPCFTVVSDQPFDAVVLRMFRAGGLLR